MRLPGWKWSGSRLPMIRNPSCDSAPSGTSAAELTASASRSKMFFCRSRSGPQRGFAARKNVANGRTSASSGRQAPDEAFAHGLGRRIGEQHEHGTLGGEILAQPRLELLEALRQIVGARMSFRHELMNLLDERVVLLRDGDEILELALELRVALPQHRDLALDERDRCAAGAVRQLEPEHQRRVTLEEVGVALEIVGDRVLGNRRRSMERRRLPRSAADS